MKNAKKRPSHLGLRRNKAPPHLCIRCVVDSSYSSWMKNVLAVCIFSVVVLHLLFLYFGLSSIYAGVCGIVMQFLYHRLISAFPDLKIESPLFISVCGKIVEILCK